MLFFHSAFEFRDYVVRSLAVTWRSYSLRCFVSVLLNAQELAGVCITKEEALAMRNAVDSMRHVTQHVNDFMHQLLITGFEVSFSHLQYLV
jgi:hypothetical protein